MNLVVIFATVICASLPTAAVGGTPLYLGAINSYTGGGWDAGVQLESGQRLALDHIKAQNLLPGYDLDLVFGNGQCNAGVGLQFFINELYTDPTAAANGKKKVVGMIGPSCSGVCQAVSQTARYFNKLTISGSCTSGALSDKGRFPYFLRTGKFSIARTFLRKGSHQAVGVPRGACTCTCACVYLGHCLRLQL